MAKDTFYFQHDYEPLSDPKLLALVGEFGAAGYGIFWRIVEMLHSDESHRLGHEKYIYSAIAKQMSTPVEQVEEVINYSIEVCKLFVSDGESFWSERVYRNVEKREEIADKKRKAGLASAQARAEMAKKSTHVEHLLTPVEQNPTEGNKEKEIKKKNNKIKDIKEDSIGNACPYDEILSLYHSQCPSLPTVAKLSDSRKEKVRLRFAEMDRKIETLQVVFENMENSEFCKGENNHGWTASFDWIFENDKNWLKVYEGKYANCNKPEKSNRHRDVTCQPGDNRGSSTL